MNLGMKFDRDENEEDDGGSYLNTEAHEVRSVRLGS